MFKKIFTSQQLSLFFQIAVLVDIIGLFCDLIIYHYFSHNNLLKLFIENVNNLSLFVICSIIVSQALMIFIKKYKNLVTHYKLITLTIEICIATFIIWLITIENTIEAKFIIFYSSASQLNHSYKIELIIITIFMLLLIDFYRNLEEPYAINEKSISEIITSSFLMVLRKHILLLIFVFGLIHFEKIHKFSVKLLQDSSSSLFFDLSILEIIIPIIWLTTIGYYIYIIFQQQNNMRKNK